MGRRMGLPRLSALAIMLGAVACRQVAGIQDSPPQDLASGVCGLAYGTSACAFCVSTNCCPESTACAADRACSDYENCLGTCKGDPKCRSQCTFDHLVGTASDVSSLSACLASKCETACDLTCGGIADIFSPPDAAVSCQQCLEEKSACSEARTCASSEACDAYSRGYLAFSTIDSVEVYSQQQCANPAAAGLAFNIGGGIYACGATPLTLDANAAQAGTATAFSLSCAGPCATGNYWACVGRVSWPPPKAPTCTIDFDITDEFGAPLAGAQVLVCGGTDGPCDAPLGAMGTTDAKGQTSVTFQNGAPGANLGINGFVQISGPNIITFDQYWGSPAAEARVPFFRTEVFTTDQLQTILQDELHVTPDSTRGTLVVNAFDCRFQAAPDVNITLLSSSDTPTQGYTRDRGATSMTDGTGSIFFPNVPAGQVQIIATPMGLGRPSSHVSVNVEPGIVTSAFVFPTP